MPRAALTFDDGPGPSTAAILDTLATHGVKATFFVLGRNVVEAPWAIDGGGARALVVRALRDGHVIGNHTYSHRRPPEGVDLFADDVRRCDEVIHACRREAGVADGPIPFRLPYGIRLLERTIAVETGTVNAVGLDPRLPILASLGRTHVHWTCDFDDWTDGDLPGLADAMLRHVAEMGARGLDAVLDLHDSGTGSGRGFARHATASAVATFCAEARRRGWDFFTVPT